MHFACNQNFFEVSNISAHVDWAFLNTIVKRNYKKIDYKSIQNLLHVENLVTNYSLRGFQFHILDQQSVDFLLDLVNQ